MRTWNINSNVNLQWRKIARNILEIKRNEEEIVLWDIKTKKFSKLHYTDAVMKK